MNILTNTELININGGAIRIVTLNDYHLKAFNKLKKWIISLFN